MNWSFGMEAEIEEELVRQCMGHEMQSAYVVEVTSRHRKGLPEMTKTTCRIVGVDWDGWVFTFELLGEEESPTGIPYPAEPFNPPQFVTMAADDIELIHVC